MLLLTWLAAPYEVIIKLLLVWINSSLFAFWWWGPDTSFFTFPDIWLVIRGAYSYSLLLDRGSIWVLRLCLYLSKLGVSWFWKSLFFGAEDYWLSAPIEDRLWMKDRSRSVMALDISSSSFLSEARACCFFISAIWVAMRSFLICSFLNSSFFLRSFSS